MENCNRSTAVAEPSIQRDEIDALRRPAFDEIPDSAETSILLESCRRIRLGRSMFADSLMHKS